jgi:hypothetical protein
VDLGVQVGEGRDAACHAENRNSNQGLRVLRGKPNTTGAGQRPTVEA